MHKTGRNSAWLLAWSFAVTYGWIVTAGPASAFSEDAAADAETAPEVGEQYAMAAPGQLGVTPVGEAVTAPLHDAFVLGPGDELKVTVWGYPELSEQVVVLPDGTLSYPLVGTVQAEGLTADGLTEALGRALERHVPSPQVSITVAEMRSRRFSVMGEVTRPGTFPLWESQLTILEAVAEAGGFTPSALPEETKLYRGQDTIPVDLAELLRWGTEGASPVLQPGDVLYIPSQMSRKKVCVLGHVNAPGLYTLTPGMTVIEALSAAGWAKRSGVLRSVMVARKGSGASHEFFRIDAQAAVSQNDWSQHMVLAPGDIVYVPETFVSKVSNFVGFFTSNVEPAAHTYLRVYDASNPANVVIER